MTTAAPEDVFERGEWVMTLNAAGGEWARTYLVTWALEDTDLGGHIITGDPVAAVCSIARRVDPDEDDLASEVRDIGPFLETDGIWYGRVNVARGVITLGTEPVFGGGRWTFQQVLDDVMEEVLMASPTTETGDNGGPEPSADRSLVGAGETV